jgi:hypothetical protein
MPSRPAAGPFPDEIVAGRYAGGPASVVGEHATNRGARSTVSDTPLTATASRRLTWRRVVVAAVVLALVGGLLAGIAVSTDTLGAGDLFERAVAKIDRFLAGPVPDRPAPGTIIIETPDESEEPDDAATESEAPSPSASSIPGGSGQIPSLVPVPTATPQPTPARVPVNLDIVKDHDAVFAHELKDTWCAPAGVQMALAVLGLGNTSNAFQRELQGRVHEWESYRDAHDGLWGPSAMSLALADYGANGYEVRGYKTRQGALRDAAKAIEKTRSPVLLLAWRGAHTWVMTGFRADADPAKFSNAKIGGAYILDPWYPDVSSIWGRSDPPGTFQDNAEMIRNYLPWKRPEGKYPERDGLFIAVVPTVKAGATH